MELKCRTAVIPGSYDPITLGHIDIIMRSIPMFNKIIIAIGENSDKKYMFSLAQRLQWIKESFEQYENVSVQSYEGLTVDFCKANKAQFIVRGLRNTSDFDFERNISGLNQKLNNNIETVFLIASPEYSFISSTIVREIIKHGGAYAQFIPSCVKF
jgi:pantetheine-phosphate adenylyltransferase